MLDQVKFSKKGDGSLMVKKTADIGGFFQQLKLLCALFELIGRQIFCCNGFARLITLASLMERRTRP